MAASVFVVGTLFPVLRSVVSPFRVVVNVISVIDVLPHQITAFTCARTRKIVCGVRIRFCLSVGGTRFPVLGGAELPLGIIVRVSASRSRRAGYNHRSGQNDCRAFFDELHFFSFIPCGALPPRLLRNKFILSLYYIKVNAFSPVLRNYLTKFVKYLRFSGG